VDGRMEQPYSNAVDRVPMIEDRPGVFSAFAEAAERVNNGYWKRNGIFPRLFRVRLEGRVSPYSINPRGARTGTAGKIIVDRITEVKACPFGEGPWDCVPLGR
jgi:hypothetical protein